MQRTLAKGIHAFKETYTRENQKDLEEGRDDQDFVLGRGVFGGVHKLDLEIIVRVIKRVLRQYVQVELFERDYFISARTHTLARAHTYTHI